MTFRSLSRGFGLSLGNLRVRNYFFRAFVRQPLGYQVRKENWIYFEQYDRMMMHEQQKIKQKVAIHTQANFVTYSSRIRIRVAMLMQPLAPYLNSSNKKCLICVVNCAVQRFFVPKKETDEPNIYWISMVCLFVFGIESKRPDDWKD